MRLGSERGVWQGQKCVGEPVGLEMIAEDFGAFININIKTCGAI